MKIGFWVDGSWKCWFMLITNVAGGKFSDYQKPLWALDRPKAGLVMSVGGLNGIYSLLPPERQKQALLSALEMMCAEGQWGALQDIAGQVPDIVADDNLRASILAIGIKASLRLREFEKAFGQFGLLSGLRTDMGIHLLQAEILYQMAIQILPLKANKLYTLWKELLFQDMPVEIQRSLAKTGVLLAQTFSKNGDPANSAAVKGELKRHLAGPVYQSLAHKLP